MTVKEFAKIADAIKTYFPRDNILPTPNAMELWFDMLKDLDYQVVSCGLKKYVSLNKFPPAISDIREYAISVSDTTEELGEFEAWAMVRKAIGKSIYNSAEEFSKLPRVVQKAVGVPEQLRIWAMDENYNESVASSNFIRTYRTVCARMEENKKIPLNIRQLIGKSQDGSCLTQKNIVKG